MVTFTGTEGQKVSLVPSETSMEGQLSLLAPSGVALEGEGATGFGEPIDGPFTLPEAGTYRIVADPTGQATGSIKVTAYSAADVTGTITPKATAEGASQAISLPTPGQVARYSVTMTAGEKVALKTTSSAFSGTYYLRWLNPSGEVVAQEGFNGTENYFWNPTTFATAGTYTLVVDPELAATGSVTLKAWEDPDVSGGSVTPSATGASKTLSLTVPGQRGVVTFTGTEGQKVSLVPSETSMEGQLSLLAPSGVALEGEGATGFGEPIDGPFTLPEAGTYRIVADPTGQATGSIKVTAYSAADVTGTITPKATAEGASQAISLPTPGQVARYSVTMTAGEKVALKTTSSAFSGTYYLRWLNPSGEVVAQEGFNGTENYFWNPTTFATAGTYTLVVDPELAATGSVTLKAWEDPDVSGGSVTPSATGASKTLSLTVPGQRGVVTFTGTKNQTLTVKAVESTVAAGRLSVLRSTGEVVGESSFSSSEAGRTEFKAPVAGTYTIVVDPTADATGGVKVIAYTGSHVAYLAPLVPETRLVSLTLPTGGGPPPSSSEPESTRPTPDPVGSSALIALVRHGVRRRDQDHPDRRRHQRRRGQDHAPPQAATHFDPSTPALWDPPRTSHAARGWVSGAPSTPWASLRPLRAGKGRTALTGQVLEQDGTPLPGVRVGIAGSPVVTMTDGSGRFLLSGVPAGRQVLVVDGDTGGRRFGTYEVAADLEDHRTTTLESTIWLTALDPAGDRPIASPTTRKTTLTDSKVPGLEVELPKGTVIRNAAGKPIRELNITAVPVDRTPAPLPTFQTIPLYYTIQPGRAYLSKGARIIYPNWSHLPPGERVSFWNYDAHGRGWYVYGEGSVSADGSQIVPDPGVRVWRFSGAMISATQSPPEEAPNEEESGGGDPVDYHSGLFTYRRTDLFLPDTLPVIVEHTYRPKDSNSYSFGKGTQGFYDMHLWSENNYQECDLVLPSGSRIHYDRISEGTGYLEAVYRSEDPGPYFGSEISWDASEPGWDLSLTDGTTYVFGVYAPLQAIRNAAGEELVLAREGGETGRITKITSPHGRWATFKYDEYNRITEITDNGGQHLKYSYEEGLLKTATNAEGGVTKYSYNSSGEMTSITDPRGVKYLETAYEPSGRVEKQTAASGATFEFAYELSKKGQVESTTLTDPQGATKKTIFGSEGRATSEIL